jgi:hypothetical protein
MRRPGRAAVGPGARQELQAVRLWAGGLARRLPRLGVGRRPPRRRADTYAIGGGTRTWAATHIRSPGRRSTSNGPKLAGSSTSAGPVHHAGRPGHADAPRPSQRRGKPAAGPATCHRPPRQVQQMRPPIGEVATTSRCQPLTRKPQTPHHLGGRGANRGPPPRLGAEDLIATSRGRPAQSQATRPRVWDGRGVTVRGEAVGCSEGGRGWGAGGVRDRGRWDEEASAAPAPQRGCRRFGFLSGPPAQDGHRPSGHHSTTDDARTVVWSASDLMRGRDRDVTVG